MLFAVNQLLRITDKLKKKEEKFPPDFFTATLVRKTWPSSPPPTPSESGNRGKSCVFIAEYIFV